MVHSVQHMKLYLQINVAWLAVLKTKFKEHKLVMNMQLTGRKVFMITVKLLLMVFDVFFNVLVNVKSGKMSLMLLFNDHMMMILNPQ